MNKSLDEAQPVGALSRAGNWLKTKVSAIAPGAAATARGAQPTGAKANNMKLEYQQWLGSIGEKPTQENLLSFLKSNKFSTKPAEQIFAGKPPTAAPAAGAPTAAPTASALLANLKQQYPSVQSMLSGLQSTQDPKAKAVVDTITSSKPATIADAVSILQKAGQLQTVDQLLAKLNPTAGGANPTGRVKSSPKRETPYVEPSKDTEKPIKQIAGNKFASGENPNPVQNDMFNDRGAAEPAATGSNPDALANKLFPKKPATADTGTGTKTAAIAKKWDKNNTSESESEKMRRFMSFLKEDTEIDDKMVNQVILAVVRDMVRNNSFPDAATGTVPQPSAQTPSSASSTAQQTSASQTSVPSSSAAASAPSASQTSSQTSAPVVSQGGGQGAAGPQLSAQGAAALTPTTPSADLLKTVKAMKQAERTLFLQAIVKQYPKSLAKYMGTATPSAPPAPPVPPKP